MLDHYRPLADWHVGDHLVGAASTFVYERIALDLTGLRLLPARGGPDAADLRLIDEATHVSRVIDLTVGHALAA